jgi:multidrug efflux system outer membrane protein
MKLLQQLTILCVILLVSVSCAVGPDYKRPDVKDITPPDWRWKTAEPKDTVPKGQWWGVFHDQVLNDLEKGAVTNNQNLQAAVASVDEARAVARLSRSEFFPDISLDPSVGRELTTGHLPTPIPVKVPAAHITTYSIPFDLSYEIDIWGRVRRSFEAAQAQAQASVSDYQNVLLTLTADVAVDYFLIRSLDSEIAILQRTIALHNERLGILNDRFSNGAIQEADVDQAKAELSNTKADLADVIRQRAETLHALALLCGKPASSFEVVERAMSTPIPVVPPGLPSSLLERRPDIARAEKDLAAVNARIGVAEAAYFPVLSLTGQAGYLSAEAGNLFSGDSRVWSVTPALSLPLFNAGRTSAGVEQAKASYQKALAEYRQTVLTAFKEVEDSLAQIKLRNEQATAQAEALAAAGRVAELARARYDVGAAGYLEVTDAERNMLQYQRLQVQIENQRLVATMRLIKALGGGFE